MEQPLISVIVPIYKVEAYLERCVESIRNQTYRNLEIILVDDGSPDRCGEMCNQLAAQDPRIRTIHKVNGGLSSARNAGLDSMTGDYVAFVDSDDYISTDMIQRLFDVLQEHDAQISCCGIERVNEHGHVGYFNPQTSDFLVLETHQALGELLYNNRITNSLCDKLYRAEIFDGLRMTEGIIYEDYDVMYRCIYRAERIIYLGEPLYYYFQSQDSILRSEFSSRHYITIDIGHRRLDFYRIYSPQNLKSAKAQYIVFGLGLLYLSRKAKDCTNLRKELIRELRHMLAEQSDLPFDRNTKLKIGFFKISPIMYILLMNVYYGIRGK